jgi:glycosyltransferase involved in cell wall biosynthesis
VGVRILHLYRPALPGQRAQAIQVVHTCHALASRGHRVTLLADAGGRPATPAAALAALGLEPVPGLDLRIAPVRQRGLAGLWFRRQLARWWAGPPGVVLARDKARLRAALDRHGPRHAVVLETHELDSALLADRGQDAAPMRALEAGLAGQAHALVANCAGTLAAWESNHGPALPALRRVVHNATAAGRARGPHPEPDRVIRCVGSLRRFKGFTGVLTAAPELPLPLHLVGGTADELGGPLPDGVRLSPALPFPEVPDLLARSAVLLLPLSDNRFGRSLTNPLKLWDYLATAAPIVAPDLPTIDEVARASGAPMHRYRPGDAASLVAAVCAALAAPPRQPHVRSWHARAAELEACLP